MSMRKRIEGLFDRQVADLVARQEFQDLENGRASPQDYDRFVASVVRTHLKSPQLVAFLYALAPPRAADHLRHNLLEELGIEDEAGVAHPSLLEDLARGSGLGARLAEFEALAASDIRKFAGDPLLYGTLRDVGLAALCEVTAFEFMLSRLASRFARALASRRGLSAASLRWFTHHSEVDVRHAEQGLDDLVEYIRAYEFSEEDAWTIVDMTLRENVFVKRYFGEMSVRL